MGKKSQTAQEINLLELIPIRNIAWEKNEDGNVTLLKPKYRNAFLAKHLLPRMKNPNFKINLDEVGSYFWENCDGTLTIKEIAERHKAKFGDKVEPLYERISLFLKTLQKNRFIIFKNWNQARHSE